MKENDKKPGRNARARGSDRAVIKRAKKLMDHLKPKHLEQAVQVWVAGLNATKEVYDPKAREWTTQPDWKERRENANMIIAYFEGRPVERQMVLSGNFKDLNEAMKRVSDSPEARRLLESMGGAVTDESLQKTSESAESSTNERGNTREPGNDGVE